MIPFLLCIIGAIIIGWRMSGGGWSGIVARIILTFMMGLLGMMVGILMTVLLSLIPVEMEEYKANTIYLYSMSDNSSVEGRFFLGGGSIGEKEYYKYYFKREDGGYKFGKIKADNAVVYEKNNVEPRIELYKTRMKNRNHEFWRMDGVCGCDERYEVYIPKGTVKQFYNLDLQ